MDFQINQGTVMNMQSEGSKVYNEGIFLMPYHMEDPKGKEENKVHIWHAGIVSYIKFDFDSEEIHDNLPKYIIEHGHKSVIMDMEEKKGTLKDISTHEAILKHIKYTPMRPLSFFEVNSRYNSKPWDLELEINKKYIEIFDENNHEELSEKLIRAYTNTLSKKDDLMKGHDDNLIVYYGSPNQRFLEILAEKSGLKGNKIYEFKGLGITDKRG